MNQSKGMEVARSARDSDEIREAVLITLGNHHAPALPTIAAA